MTSRSWTAALLLVASALALAIRLGSWSTVFAEGEPRLLADTDPHYHVLHAWRMAAGEPGATWFDPRLDWPNGARVPWPPLFDAILAAAARVAAPSADVAGVTRVAVFVAPILGALAVLAAGLLGAALAGRTAGVVSAFLVALLPSHVGASWLGRPDQHALEVLLALVSWWLFVAAWRDGARRRIAVAAGAVLGLAFWNWMGSALVLCFPAAGVALLWLGGIEGAAAAAGALAISCGVGAALLAASVALLAPAGALLDPSLLAVGGLHVAILAGCAGFGALLPVAARRRRAPAGVARRALEVVAALAVPAAVLMGALPGFRRGAVHGLEVLAAAGAWYGSIGEFEPLVGSGAVPIGQELRFALATHGLVPVAALLGLPALAARWRAEPRDRAAIAVVALWAALGLVLALARTRFAAYAAALLAIALSTELVWFAARVERRWGAAGRVAALALGAAVALLPAFPSLAEPPAAISGPVVDALAWLRVQPRAAHGADGVACDWDLGHAVQYYADRPVLVSPFGTEAGDRAMQDWAALVFAPDERSALEILSRRRIGWIVLHDATAALARLGPFAPPGTPPAIEVTRDWRTGERIRALPSLPATLYFRLLVGDGLSAAGAPLSGLRLVHETGTTFGPWQLAKVFGVVAGARVRIAGGPPGAAVELEIPLRTWAARTLALRRVATLGPDGAVEVRVPYSTGANGTTLAGPLHVTAGDRDAVVAVPEAAVVEGGAVDVQLGR